MSTPLTDAGVGRALFTTRFTLSIQAFKMCVLVGALPGLFLPFVLWLNIASIQSVDLVRLNAVSHLISQDAPARWRLTGPDGERKVVEALLSDGRYAEWFTPAQIRVVLSKPMERAMTTFHAVEVIAVICMIIGFLLMRGFLRRLGGMSQKDKRIRGAYDLVSQDELTSMVRQAGGDQYALAGVALPKDAPQRGIQVMGSQGSGKSVALHDLMRQVFQRKGRKSIIYDQSGEFFRAYFRPGKDYFFNPALIGSVPWSIFAEIKYNYDADTQARAFLPPKAGVVSGGAAFFEDAARALFSVLLTRLKGRGARDTRDIAKAFLEMPADEMEYLIAKSVASSAVGGDSKGQRQGVISSIAIYLNGIAAVQPGDWSVRSFLEEDSDARLFILGTADTRTMFSPLYRLMLTACFDAIEAKQQIVHEDRYWFWLDEAHTLGDTRLDEVLATKRKYGVVVVTGIQSDSQYVQSMGQDRAATVANCFNTNLVLACNDPGLQERSAKLLGKQEMDTVSRNQALANNESRDGAALNRSDAERWLVMPAQLGTLDTCTGYLKLPGTLPVATVDYRSWFRKPFWGGRARVELGNPVVPVPDRDDRFLVQVAPSGSGDPFDQVRAELEQLKQVAAEEAAEAEKASAADGTATSRVSATPAASSTLALTKARGTPRPQSEAAPTAPAASAPAAPSGAGGRSGIAPSDAQFPLLRATIDQETGEILDKPVNKGLALAQSMDTNRPGHTLGLDLEIGDR